MRGLLLSVVTLFRAVWEKNQSFWTTSTTSDGRLKTELLTRRAANRGLKYAALWHSFFPSLDESSSRVPFHPRHLSSLGPSSPSHLGPRHRAPRAPGAEPPSPAPSGNLGAPQLECEGSSYFNFIPPSAGHLLCSPHTEPTQSILSFFGRWWWWWCGVGGGAQGVGGSWLPPPPTKATN